MRKTAEAALDALHSMMRYPIAAVHAWLAALLPFLLLIAHPAAAVHWYLDYGRCSFQTMT